VDKFKEVSKDRQKLKDVVPDVYSYLMGNPNMQLKGGRQVSFEEMKESFKEMAGKNEGELEDGI